LDSEEEKNFSKTANSPSEKGKGAKRKPIRLGKLAEKKELLGRGGS